LLQKIWQPSDRSFAAAREVKLVCAARGVRGFGDGFAIIILPAYLSAIGFDAVEVGIVATAALLGSAVMTLAIGHLAARHDLRPFLIVGALVMVATGLALPQIEHIAFIATVAFFGTVNPQPGDIGMLVPLEQAMLAHGVRERIEYPVTVFPADTGIRDALAVDEFLSRH